jgi:hypothetical protein
MQNVSEKSTDELLYKYWKLMDVADHSEYALREREIIMAELRKRARERQPSPKGHCP